MWPLLACSVAALAMILERLYFFSAYGEDKFLYLVNQFSNPSGLQESKDVAQERILWEHEKIVTRGFSSLDLIVSLSPLLGLFGTILGLVHVYFKLGFSSGNPQRETIMSSGIAEALFTTLAGLAIAIPSLFFIGVFRARAGHLMKSFELRVKELLHNGYEEAKH